MKNPPRWAIFAIGLIFVLVLVERRPKIGWPLLWVLVLAMFLTHPDLLKRMGLGQKGG